MNHPNDRWIEDRMAALDPVLDVKSPWRPDTERAWARFHQGGSKKSAGSRKWGWLAAGVVAAGLPLMAFPTTRAFAQRCVSACVGQSSWVHDLFAGSTRGTGQVNAQDLKMAPDFVLHDAAGKPVRLSDFRGQVVLLNFWATWCAPCRVEIPWFTEFQKANKASGFTVLGVSLDEDGWDAVTPYVAQHKINYPVLAGNDEVARLYGAESLPTTFVIDKFGRIVAAHTGLCSKSEYEADLRTAFQQQ